MGTEKTGTAGTDQIMKKAEELAEKRLEEMRKKAAAERAGKMKRLVFLGAVCAVAAMGAMFAVITEMTM